MQEQLREREKVFRFDDVEVRARPIGVRRGDRMIGVEPKAHAVLMVLLNRAGEAIERETLLDTVWGHRHVTPSVLNRIVAQLRRALGDDASNPRYIQTLHGRGYRFMVQPQRLEGADGAGAAAGADGADGAAGQADDAAANGDATQEHAVSPRH